ncbi:TetR/AcrR family transcriptional regulator [Larkinella rosea]|uniref:TetR/AcrR family transcriptional regulator n=1 Tax=Larkinella rosea TaxID=2025312 RepID=A0A3P1BBW3_9BACT|nr:TetR/AcrR family transcriptional regulator [Larkinella rosea]RRA98540.1 TetR/AcrR family transcriptional regulator [Larkinella rosea]
MELKERILVKAEALFWKFGTRSITMDDISRDIGISKKTLYQHFTDKDDIVYQVMLYRLDKNRENVSCQMATAHDPVEEILLASEMMRQHLAEMNPALLIDLQRHYPRAWEVCTEFKEKFLLESIRANLKRGIEEGLYRPEIDVEIMARLRVEMMRVAFDTEVFPRALTGMIEVQIQLLHHFVRGILTEKGLFIYNQYVQKHQNEPATTTL